MYRRVITLCGICCALAPHPLLSTGAAAQEPPRRGVELRVGALLSTALVHDEVMRPAPDMPVPVSEAQLRASPAPMLGLAFWTELRPNVELEVSGGWTFARLMAHEEGNRRSTGGLGIGHALVALRHHAQDVRLRGGIGAIAYRSDAPLFRQGGGEMRPMAEVGLGWEVRAGGARLVVDATAQVHAFGTQALREAGGLDGMVTRFGVSAAYSPWVRP